MKIRNIFYIGLLFLISTIGYAQQIYRAGNGVTIIAAPTAITGDSYTLDGTPVSYTHLPLPTSDLV